MDTELSTFDGKRKYLTLNEQQQFLKATSELERPEVRTFCDTLAYTGCRISEALALTPQRIDLSARAITFQTLKQRGKVRFRSVPIPEQHLDCLLYTSPSPRDQRGSRMPSSA